MARICEGPRKPPRISCVLSVSSDRGEFPPLWVELLCRFGQHLIHQLVERNPAAGQFGFAVAHQYFGRHRTQVVETSHRVAIGAAIFDGQDVAFADFGNFATFGELVAGFADIADHVIGFRRAVRVGQITDMMISAVEYRTDQLRETGVATRNQIAVIVFDGIDLDWEYPVAGGMSENRVRPEDKQNFTALIKTIREKLDKQSAEDGKEYLLTIAGAASEKYINNIEMNKLSKYLDYINVMTYDINGPWDSYNDFNAALYPHDKKGKDQQWSVSQGIKLYLAQGVPSAKLVMGVPFYGYKYELKEKGQTDDEGLLQSFSQGMYMDCGRIEKEFSQKQSFKRFWQDTSKVPWLYDGNTFITYEDAQSMTEKVRYAVDMNLGGLMIWELSNDPDNVLLNAINDEFSNEAEK